VLPAVSWAVVVRITNVTVMQSVRFLQVPPQMNEQSNRNTHDDQRTETQDQKPPDHPHSRLG
jgi:hypothetical protein